MKYIAQIFFCISLQVLANDTLVFISLSMPTSTLKTLYKDVSKAKGRLIMRGLYKNSFIETQKIFKNLEIEAEIDPDLFDLYQIKHVPTFVIVEGSDVQKVEGNISLSHALRVLEI